MDLADSENPGGFAHTAALDGIRGAAILVVLVYHLLWSNPITGSPILDLLQEIRSATYCGVNLFFALSGFLITGILLDTLDAPALLPDLLRASHPAPFPSSRSRC